MKKPLILLVVVLVAGRLAAQPITMYKTFGNVQFERDTLTLTFRQVSDLLSVNQKAFHQFRVAKTNYNAAAVLGVAGSVLIAVPIVTAIAGGEPEWILAGGGAALVLASIPFNRAFKIRAGAALDDYNSQQPKSRLSKPEFFFTGRGAGLRLRFR